MTLPLDIVTYDEVLRRRPGAVRSAHSLFITPEALEQMASTVGSRPPESGAKLFGPSTLSGVDRVEFDSPGSATAGAAVYAPDVAWSDERIAFWLAQEEDEMRLWSGDVHSHPNGIGFPSMAAGKGLGDLGYAAEVLASVEWMDAFFMPIVTNPGNRWPRLWPWVVAREEPDVAQYADVHVVPLTSFPARRFNPQWEAALGVHPPNAPLDPGQPGPLVHLIALDLSAVAVLVRAGIRASPKGVVFSRKGVEVSISLPPGFPRDPPEVRLRGRSGARRFRFAWRTNHPHAPERRLTRLVSAAITAAQQEF